jgi:hypothetical protein
MWNTTKIILTVALALSNAVAASAATEPGRGIHVYPRIYATVPGFSNDYCPASGGPACSSRCLPSGPPCKTEPDGW